MDTSRDLRLAARAMARFGLVHAYGHVSERIDESHFVASPPRPLGSIAVGEVGTVIPVTGPIPDGALGELRVHQSIYRGRRDVGGICRMQPPQLMALSALGRTPRALHGLGAYFAPNPPLWQDPRLLRDDTLAAAVAAQLGSARAIVLRGNGAVTVGATIREAACHAFFLEDAARLEVALLGAGSAALPYTTQEAADRAQARGVLYERMWCYLTHDDPEAYA